MTWTLFVHYRHYEDAKVKVHCDKDVVMNMNSARDFSFAVSSKQEEILIYLNDVQRFKIKIPSDKQTKDLHINIGYSYEADFDYYTFGHMDGQVGIFLVSTDNYVFYQVKQLSESSSQSSFVNAVLGYKKSHSNKFDSKCYISRGDTTYMPLSNYNNTDTVKSLCSQTIPNYEIA